ncbi:MAG: hypothetical protein AABX17_00485 [Nanoarchaeota archaeon]
MDSNQVKKLEEQTKKLLEKFSKALASVKSEGEEWNVERKNDRRAEKEGKNCDNDFRQIMLNNAPNHDDNVIIGERKTW